ncbi:ABC transporter permease [Schaalia sp. ZJ405]|uniref:ABC transporter permease n=1 Tax=unclassified Schaalia TaxID=2691889 RepID=UPI0013EC5CF5|nr:MULTISPECIES: ABC transporter permease [unclassified Schaalia]QPK81159.1 ABC transporter permease [Schaalia sp. ZJ405]
MKWLALNWPMTLPLLVQHLALALPAIVFSAIIAVPIGRLAHRHPRLGRPLVSATTLLYAIPSLPLLIIVPSLFGTRLRSGATMIIALTIYGVSLMVRTAVDAFASVDQSVLSAATALGFSRRSLLWKVELPLALSVMISGLRVVAMSTIGLVTIGSLVGIHSLGSLLTDGFQRGILAEVLTGIVLTVLLAFVVDGILVLIGKVLTPWAQTGGAR